MSQHALIFFKAQIRTKKNGKTARHSRTTGRIWLQPKAGTRASQDALHWEAMEQIRKADWKLTDQPCSLKLTFSWNGRADVIGLAETVLDALEGVVYVNDRQARQVMMDMLPKGSIQERQGITCEAQIFD